jgi:hypothetical protein
MDCAWELIAARVTSDKSTAMVSRNRPILGTMVSP